MSNIELCQVCKKPESVIDHQEHPHNGSPIGHYYQASGKFITLDEWARRKEVEELKGNVGYRWRLRDTKKALCSALARLKKIQHRGRK